MFEYAFFYTMKAKQTGQEEHVTFILGDILNRKHCPGFVMVAVSVWSQTGPFLWPRLHQLADVLPEIALLLGVTLHVHAVMSKELHVYSDVVGRDNLSSR